MGEAQLAARVGQADLAVVHVAGEDEVERPGRHQVDDPREVAEQDAQVRPRIRKLPRPGLEPHVRPRIDADELDAAPAQLDA